MLPEKPWKADALLRLGARVLICIFMGTLVNSVIAFLRGPHPAGAAGFLGLTAGAFGLFGGALFVLGRPWRIETLTRHLVILLLCFYVGLVLTWWALRWRGDTTEVENSALSMLVAVLSFQGAALVLTHRFLSEYRIGWTEAFGFHLGRRRALLLGLAAAFLILPLGDGLESVSALVMERLHLPHQEQLAVQLLRTSSGWANRLTFGIAAVLIAPVGEEVLFRGILYPAIRQWGFPALAWWGTSLLFGAIHLNLVTLVPLTVLALVLTWLYEKTGNLLAPIAAHMLFNALNFAAVFLTGPADRWSGK